MLRTDPEYKAAQLQLSKLNELLAQQKKKFEEQGFNTEQVDNLMAPTLTYAKQAAEEIKFYEQLKRGEIPPTSSLSSIGQLLVALRIAKGISQRDLAHLLGVSEAVVSRDERNEYHGVTMDKTQRIIDALGASVEVKLTLSDNVATRVSKV